MSILSRTKLEALADQTDGWHISIFMPTEKVGKAAEQNPIRLKNLLTEASETLEAAGMRAPEIEALLAPANRLLSDTLFWQHQREGIALFLSQAMYKAYRLPLTFNQSVIVSERFHIKPLLPLLSKDGRFYILALSQHEIRLFEGTKSGVEAVEIEDIPQNANELLKEDQEAHLQFHTSTGVPGGIGARDAVFHGHGIFKNSEKDMILRYFRKVNETVQEALGNEQAPLILAGVAYLFPIYEEANTYPNLLEEGIPGNPEETSPEDLHEQAWSLVAPRFQEEQEEARTIYKHLSGTNSSRAADTLEVIVPAAHHQRIDTLFVALGTQRWGKFDPETNSMSLHQEFETGDEDLLDFAAIHTLLNNGSVYAVAPEDVPGGAPAVAILRY